MVSNNTDPSEGRSTCCPISYQSPPHTDHQSVNFTREQSPFPEFDRQSSGDVEKYCTYASSKCKWDLCVGDDGTRTSLKQLVPSHQMDEVVSRLTVKVQRRGFLRDGVQLFLPKPNVHFADSSGSIV
jgi:hypothetical protein